MGIETGHHFLNEGVRCPYCDHMHHPFDSFYFDEDTTEMECERCDKAFDMQVHVSTSWSSFPKESPHA